MDFIRPAVPKDLARIAEIEIFNYRLNFYPIFRCDEFYFDQLQVPVLMKQYETALPRLWVYDDGVVKGFMKVENQQLQKLFVEPVLQGQSIGAALLTFAIRQMDVQFLWALEKNVRAIAFYHRHGFRLTAHRCLEEDTTEYLVRLER